MTTQEKKVVMAVFGELVKKPYEELNLFLGSITIKEMQEMYNKLKYSDWCNVNGIRYEEMTEDDFINAQMEMSGYY